MRGITGGRLVAVSGLALAAALGTSMNLDAQAAALPQRALATPAGDHNSTGNGRGNANSVSVRDITTLKGIQHVADGNAVALVNTNNALCKKRRYCRIRQRAINIVR
ncbi:hypothetical protein NE236_17265 [Actinoallomurus purpureus]|uniref:hypothetical protein n=1 Tax=Actinoallomurus purpureus TaxID=478114 RepID=UPI0020925E12|nr:hypothetical protein [Actinoallomurus purpureus]MCO6006737.1 hypothetical protein [Actinoallomurus purpureus]